MPLVSTPSIVPTCAARRTCGICASIGLLKSCTMICMPCALAQQPLKSAPLWVLQVFSATPVQPSSRPSRMSFQLCALSSRNSGLREEIARTSIGFFSKSYGKRLFDVERRLKISGFVGAQAVQNLDDVLRVVDGAVEISAEFLRAGFDGDFADANNAFVIPRASLPRNLIFKQFSPSRAIQSRSRTG